MGSRGKKCFILMQTPSFPLPKGKQAEAPPIALRQDRAGSLSAVLFYKGCSAPAAEQACFLVPLVSETQPMAEGKQLYFCSRNTVDMAARAAEPSESCAGRGLR